MRVYLIDDDVEEAELFNDAVLSINEAIIVRSFNNGRDALKVLTTEDVKPSVIFLDLNMPKFSGKDVLRELRLNPITSSIPVVIYSTTISNKDIEETSAYTVRAYLQKPESFDLLCQQLSEQLVVS